MRKTDKIIVSNLGALQKKYKHDSAEVVGLLHSVVVADKRKGLTTELIFVDDKSRLSALGIKKPVPSATSQRANKNIIDQLYHAMVPDYIMLFGAVDVMPQIELLNPLFKPNDDDDQHVKSDLPYACEAKYSTDVNDFLFPTRVVGRLPDINGVADIEYVKKVIGYANNFVSKSAGVYKSYFAVSAHVWAASTQLSVKNIFEGNSLVKEVPNDGPNWATRQLSAMSHYVNCHGSPQDFHWYGQRGENYPVSVYAKQIDGKINPGTIVAAECCYGAQLFNPGEQSDVKPICNTYLGNGAVAFLGSSTIAYGPARGNDQADLLTQYFLNNMIWNGASSGRALLEARQKYILNHGPDLSPTDLKTVAQFNLLGDPSIHPVRMATTVDHNGKEDFMKQFYADHGREERRKYLVSKGNSLKTFVNKVVRGNKINITPGNQKEIHEVLKQLNVKTRTGTTFTVEQNSANSKSFKESRAMDARYHIFSEKIRLTVKEKNSSANMDAGYYAPVTHTLTSIKELGGKVVNIQHYVRK
jgi:hypothetical protein